MFCMYSQSGVIILRIIVVLTENPNVAMFVNVKHAPKL